MRGAIVVLLVAVVSLLLLACLDGPRLMGASAYASYDIAGVSATAARAKDAGRDAVAREDLPRSAAASLEPQGSASTVRMLLPTWVPAALARSRLTVDLSAPWPGVSWYHTPQRSYVNVTWRRLLNSDLNAILHDSRRPKVSRERLRGRRVYWVRADMSDFYVWREAGHTYQLLRKLMSAPSKSDLARIVSRARFRVLRRSWKPGSRTRPPLPAKVYAARAYKPRNWCPTNRSCLRGLRWSRWTARSARGTATSARDCAPGGPCLTHRHVAVSLGTPRRRCGATRFTRLRMYGRGFRLDMFCFVYQ